MKRRMSGMRQGVADAASGHPLSGTHRMRSERMMGAKGKVTEDDGSFDRAFWKTATPEEKIDAIFEPRELYYEMKDPGTYARSMDRSVGGTRRLWEKSDD